MALFGNKNKQTIEELENYYSNKEQKTGMAWVMAFLSLLLTVVVLGGIFFGGRAVYRALSDDGTKSTTVSETSTSDNSATEKTPGEATPTPPADNPSNTTPAPTPQSSGVVSDQAASTTTPSTTAANSSAGQGGEGATTRPAAAVAGASTGLPNTGSGPVLLVVPLTTLVVSFFAARRKFLRS